MADRRCRRSGSGYLHNLVEAASVDPEYPAILCTFTRARRKAGNAPSRIIGIAFAKSARQNAEVIVRLPSCRIWAVRSSSVRRVRFGDDRGQGGTVGTTLPVAPALAGPFVFTTSPNVLH
jgi:hypothetical protein